VYAAGPAQRLASATASLAACAASAARRRHPDEQRQRRICRAGKTARTTCSAQGQSGGARCPRGLVRKGENVPPWACPIRQVSRRRSEKSNAAAAGRDRVRRIRFARRITRRHRRALDVGGRDRQRPRVDARRDGRSHARRRLAVGILLAGLAMRCAQVGRRRIHGGVAEDASGQADHRRADPGHISPGNPARADTGHHRSLRCRAGTGCHRHLGEHRHPNQQTGDESTHGSRHQAVACCRLQMAQRERCAELCRRISR
jgi:hypothetical protein